MSEHTPFLTIFPGCAGLAGSAGGLDKAYVTEVQVDSGEMTLSILRLVCVHALPCGHRHHKQPHP